MRIAGLPLAARRLRHQAVPALPNRVSGWSHTLPEQSLMNACKHVVWGWIVLALMTSGAVAFADEPVAVAGTWTWQWKDAQGETHKHTLVVEGTGDKLAGRERFDDESAVKVDDLKVSGKTIQFSVSRKKSRAEYKGTIASGETINGEVTITNDGQASEFGWTAKREVPGK